jgi:TldD protein
MDKIFLRLQTKMGSLDSEYSDARYVELKRLKIKTCDGHLEEAKETFSRGVGFRVLKDGAFGFSSTGNLSETSIFSHLNQAYQIAKRFSKIRHTEVKLVPSRPVKKNWNTPIGIDPGSLSLKK